MKSSKTRIINAFTATVIALFFISGIQTAYAQNLLCGVTELTFTANSGFIGPTISDDGRFVTFASNGNLTGQNSDLNLEIFLYDSASGVTSQLTNSVGIFNSTPFISGDGKKIVFASNRNDQGGNPDGSSEIFLYDMQTTAVTQLTFGTIGNSIDSIDATGSTISFYSWDNYTGGNADNNVEVFVYKVATDQFTQITTSTGGGFLHGGSRLDANGTHLIFGSFLDLAGIDPGFRFRVFSKDLVAGTLKQISEIGTSSSPGSISKDGRYFFFFSSAYAAANPEGNFELFVYDSMTGGTQMLTSTGTGEYNSYPEVSNDGTRISFFSTHDWTGENPDNNNEVYLMDLPTGSKTQVTHTQGSEIYPQRLSGNGEHVVFLSNLFPELGNADGSYEVFLASCIPPPSADLSVSIGANNINPKQNDKITYTVTVKNFGVNAAQNVVVNDLLSSGSTFVSAQANKGTFTTPAAGQTGSVSWNIGSLADNSQESAQIQVTVILRGKGAITNTATVASPTFDPNTANNLASLSLSVGAGGKK